MSAVVLSYAALGLISLSGGGIYVLESSDRWQDSDEFMRWVRRVVGNAGGIERPQ